MDADECHDLIYLQGESSFRVKNEWRWSEWKQVDLLIVQASESVVMTWTSMVAAESEVWTYSVCILESVVVFTSLSDGSY